MKNNDLEKVDNKKEKIDVNKNIETKVVLERRKPSVFLSVILILIGAVLTALMFLIFFGDRIVNEKNQEVQEENLANDENTEVKEVVKEVRKLNLNVDGDFITLLYGKLTTFNTFLPLVYNTDKTTFDSLSDNNKLLYTLNNSKRTKINLSQISSKLDNKMSYTEQEIARYYAEKIEIKNASKKYKSIYGEDKEIPLIDADNGMGYVYEYVPEDNCFYGHSYMGGGGSSFTYKTNITKDKNYLKFCYALNINKEDLFKYDSSFNSLCNEYLNAAFYLDREKRIQLFEDITEYSVKINKTPQYLEYLVVEFVNQCIIDGLELSDYDGSTFFTLQD